MSSNSSSTYKKETAWEFKRRRAIQLMQEGENRGLISRVLGVSPRSLYSLHTQLRTGGSVKIRLPSGRRAGCHLSKLRHCENFSKKGRLLLGGTMSYGLPQG
jgi:hypothetical protein